MQIFSDHPVGLKPYGQPGQLPKGDFIAIIDFDNGKHSFLLLGEKLNFMELFYFLCVICINL